MGLPDFRSAAQTIADEQAVITARMEATIAKIDDAETNGLAGVHNSLAYRVGEIERHFHNSLQVYGLTSNQMARKSTSPIVVTGGNGAWGTELMLTDGTVIEEGDSSKYFDFNQIFVIAVGTANRVTILEFYKNTPGAFKEVTIDETGGTVENMFEAVAHGFVNGDKVMLSDIVTTTGINTYTVYYVVGKSDDYFQLSLTVGGAAVAVSGDGSCTVTKFTQTLITETLISKAATNSDVLNQTIMMGRQTCNTVLSCRGWAAGGTNAISFFAGLHIYSS